MKKKDVCTKTIYLQFAALTTTKDALILMSQNNNDDTKAYTDAVRIIHGPQGPQTKYPVILLCTSTDISDISNIAEKKVQENSETLKEFPDVADVYVTQILYDGDYPDSRIRWTIR